MIAVVSVWSRVRTLRRVAVLIMSIAEARYNSEHTQVSVHCVNVAV